MCKARRVKQGLSLEQGHFPKPVAASGHSPRGHLPDPSPAVPVRLSGAPQLITPVAVLPTLTPRCRVPHACHEVSSSCPVSLLALSALATNSHTDQRWPYFPQPRTEGCGGSPSSSAFPETVTLKDPVTLSAGPAALPLTKHAITETRCLSLCRRGGGGGEHCPQALVPSRPAGGAGPQPTCDRTFSWLSASFCRVSSCTGAPVGVAGGSLVPAGSLVPTGATPDTQPGATPRARQRTSGRSPAMRETGRGSGPPGERLGSGSWQGLGREGVWVRPEGWLLRAPSPAGCGRAGQAGAPRRPWSSPPAPAALTGVHGPPSASSSAEDSGGRRGPGSCRRGAPGGRLGAWGRAGSLGRGGSGPARAAGRGRSLALAERGRSLYCAGLGEGGGGARGGGRTGKRPGAPLRWAERPRCGAEGRPFSSCDHKWRRESSDPGPGP